MILSMLAALAIQAAESTTPAPEASERLRLAAPDAAAFPNTTLHGYVLQATSPRAIRAEMNRLRPRVNGRQHDATTSWRYSLRLMSSGGRCDPTTAVADYTISIVMPDLQDRERLRRQDKQAWDRYFSALQMHEVNHARIAQLGAQQYQAAIRSAPTCEAGRAAAAQVAADVSAASAEYDRITEHGRHEGAVYPN
jgi:predicted secreted Zn-dependent protease